MSFDSTSCHAIAALDFRYGLVADGDEFERITDEIRHGKAEWIMKQNQQRDWFRISYKSQDLLAVYDSYSESIVTFLPPDRLEKPMPPKWKN